MLKDRIKKFYKSQRALQKVLRVKNYQQIWEAIQPNTSQITLRQRIEKHLDKLESKAT